MSTTTVNAGSTLTTTPTLGSGDTLDVLSGGFIVNTGTSQAVAWTGGSKPSIISVAGTITAYGAGDRGIDGSGTPKSGSALNITVTSTGRISSNDDAIREKNTFDSGTISIDNSGFIVSGTLSSAGVISGSSSGQAIDLTAITSTSTAITITNEVGGVIGAADADAIRPGTNTVVNNYGTIVAQSANGDTGNDGVDFQTTGAGTVTNFASGVIIGARDAITGKLAVTVNNAGTLIGQLGSGLNMDTTAGVMVVNNTGTISGTAAGTTDGDGIDIDYLVNITNSGTINAFGTSTGNLSEAITIGGGTITNQAGGVVYSVQRAITVDDSNDGNAPGATTIFNAGTINGADGQAISITDTFVDTITNQGVIEGSVTNGSGNDVFNAYTGSTTTGTIDGGAGSDTFSLDGTGTGTLHDVTNFETLNVNSGTWTLTDSESYSAGITIASGADLQIGTGGTAGALTGAITDNGMLTADRSDLLSLSSVAGSGGVVQAGSGTLDLTGANSFTGGTTLTNGTLELGSNSAAGTGAINFANGATATLHLDAGVVPTNTISGFGTTDAIDLAGFTATAQTSFDSTTDRLTVTDGSGHSATLQFAGDFSGMFFHATPSADGVAITEDSSPACYLQGTLIMTAAGPVPVETLAIGDHVVTASGGNTKVRWIGRRSYTGWRVRGNPALMPICFKAGSLADGIPARDLRVSPEHAMLIDGALFPARTLVNGDTIVIDTQQTAIHYVHIELDQHDAVLAEGAWSETFIEDSGRGMFQNAAEFAALYSASAPPRAFCAPRIEDGFALEACRAKLNRRAAAALALAA